MKFFFKRAFIFFFLFTFCFVENTERLKAHEVIKVKSSRWLHGADAAITFTWDDTDYSHPKIATILDEYGFKGSFFVYPGRHSWCLPAVQTIYPPMVIKGHEVGNHTMNHPRLTDLTCRDEIIFEINKPIQLIYDATGVWPLSFVHPHNATNAFIDSVVFASHLFARISSQHNMKGRILRSVVSSTTINQMQSWIDETINTGEWFIIAGHGIDGSQWEPITSEFLHQTCQIIKNNEKHIWVGTMAEIGAYEYLREELNIKYYSLKDGVLVLLNGYNEKKYEKISSLPFTLELKLDTGYYIDPEKNPEISILYRKATDDYLLTFDVKEFNSFLYIELEMENRVVMNEVMSKNDGYISDEDGEFFPWIELYNYSDTKISLDNYSISKYNEKETKYKLPNLKINPNEFITIFMSGKNRGEFVGNFDTLWINKLDEISGLWLFNNNYGIVLDESKNSNNGFSYEAVSKAWGKWFNYMDFDPEKQAYIEIPNNSTLQTSGNMTLSMWLYIRSFDKRQNPWSKAYGGEGAITIETTGKISYYYGIHGGNGLPYHTFRTEKILPLNEWVHVTVVRDFDEGALKWYFNGQNVKTSPTSYGYASTSELPVFLGTGYAGNFDGKIAIPILLPYALSPQQVNDLYNVRFADEMHASFTIDEHHQKLFLTHPTGSFLDSVLVSDVLANRTYGRYPNGKGNWNYLESPTFNLQNTNNLLFHKLSYNSESGGVIQGDTIQYIYHKENGETVIAIPKDGYTFIKWSDGLYQNPRKDENIIECLRITAKYESKIYKVTYILDGGINYVSNPVIFTINDLPIPLYPASKVGYTFKGWYNDEHFENEITDIDTIANITFFANFEAIQYSINYILHGGSNNTSNPNTFTVEDLPINLEPASKEGYKFKGWFYENSFENNATVIDFIDDITLYAHFEQDGNTFIPIIYENKYSLVNVFPNPAKDKLFVEVQNHYLGDCVISIFDILGNEILIEQYNQFERITINTSTLPPNIYILRLKLNNRLYTRKFIKE
jgi:uncharacterized repeat protein (TIGR02543 family)